MTCRIEDGVTYKQTYNAENRISSIAKFDGNCDSTTIIESWSYAYDGDGNRVTTLYDDGSSTLTTRYYFGSAYETHSDGTTLKYYSIAGQTVAMRDDAGLKYFLTDHLGSVVTVLDASGGVISEQRYLPFGEVRTDVGAITQTDFGYTFQRNLPDTGLMDYKARFYSPYITQFSQPDTIVPGAGNPQSWNRFSYVKNNPINFIDPTGHWEDEGCGSGKLCELPLSEPEEIINDPDKDNEEISRQEELFTLPFAGSGPNGSWTNSDWLRECLKSHELANLRSIKRIIAT